MVHLGEDGAKTKQNENISFETRFADSCSPFNKYFHSTCSLPCAVLSTREQNDMADVTWPLL